MFSHIQPNFNPRNIGALTLDLTHFPRGAKSSKLCTLDMLNGSAPQMNLFKHKRVKGWWPFYVKVTGEEMELTVGDGRGFFRVV